jgi:hypothetical protein
MGKRYTTAIAGLVAVAALLAAPAAMASTEVGNNCKANNGALGNFTLLQLVRAPGAPLPLTVPSSGVVTKWKVDSAVPSTFIERMRVLRATGKANEFTAVGESTGQSVSPGLNAFDTRVAVTAGDRIGVSSVNPSAALYCETGKVEDGSGVLPEYLTTGSTNTFSAATGIQVAVSAVVEPDADNDGYGDETQDGCPQSAAFQTVCPVVTLSTFSIVKKGSVVFLVAASSQAPVTVSGTVKLGKGKQAKLKGGVQTVLPAKITQFRLKFTNKLKSRLKELSPKQSLKLNVLTSATDLVGRVTTSSAKVKLPGQG